MAGMSTRRARVLRLLDRRGALGGVAYWFAAPHIRSAALLLDLTGAAPQRPHVAAGRASRRVQ